MVAVGEPVLYRPGPSRWTREALVEELKARLSALVQQAFLFGSQARRSANADSDIDLIVIAPTELPFIKRPFAFLDALAGLGAVDLLVYTPEEWSQMERFGHPFVDPIRDELVRIV